MMNIICKELDSSHIPQFFALCRELEGQRAGVSFVRYQSEEQLQQVLADEYIHLFGAFDGDKLVGVFQARQGQGNKAHSCHIGGAVTSELRGKKVSSRMMEYALTQLKDRGIWMIRAYVYSDNPSSVASLLAAGFTWAGTVYKHQWDDSTNRWIDDLIFHKEI